MDRIKFRISIEFPDGVTPDYVIGVFEAAMDDLADAHPDWHLPEEAIIE